MISPPSDRVHVFLTRPPHEKFAEQLEQAGIWPRLPEAGRSLVLSVEAENGRDSETRRPCICRVSLEVIASNRLAFEAAAETSWRAWPHPLVW